MPIMKDDLTPDPTSDVFTAMLWSAPKNEHILRSYINAVLTDAGVPPITRATVLNPFNIKDFAESKTIILDVRVEDESGRLYDIEVQGAGHVAFPNRMLGYWSDIYASQLKSGVNYSALRPVISIILTEFPIFPELNNVHSVFQITARENPEVLLTHDFQIHFVRLSEIHQGHLAKLDDLRRDLRHWVNFLAFAAEKTEEEMSNMTNNDPIIREAYEEMQRFYANPETREQARQRRQFIFDYNYGMNVSREEGEAKGRAEGEAKGRAETIIRLLTRRFGAISQSLEHDLYSITDIKRLDRLADLVLDCQSLKEFESNLRVK